MIFFTGTMKRPLKLKSFSKINLSKSKRLGQQWDIFLRAQIPKIYTSLAPSYPLSVSRQVIGTGALGYFQGRYFLAEFPSIYILSADIDHINWIRVIVDDVFRGDPIEFDEFISSDFRVYYFDQKHKGGHLLMLQKTVELERKFSISSPKGLDYFDGMKKVSRFYFLRWGGEADIKMLVTRFIRFVRQRLFIFSTQLSDSAKTKDFCMLNSLPPAGIDQVRCDLDQHYEAIWNVFGGVPDLFHPPVFYSLDGIRLPLQDGKLATSPVEYFTRNYPGLQVAVVDAPLNDNWLSMTFIVPPGFQVIESNFYTTVLSRAITGLAYSVLPKDKKLPGGFCHILAFSKTPRIDFEFETLPEGRARAKISKVGERNPVYMVSFVRQSTLHMPGEQKIEEVFRIFVNKANARTGLCMDPPSKECPKPSPPLDDIYQLLKNYMHQVSREIPELVINKEVEIDVVGSTGEHFEHMFEAEGMFLWVCNTEALSWLQINVPSTEDQNADGLELHEMGFTGTVLRTFDGTSSGINVLLIMKAQDDVTRRYSISKQSGNCAHFSLVSLRKSRKHRIG